jgi:Protein of unknown function (DUF433)
LFALLREAGVLPAHASLLIVWDSFSEGATPEEICQDFPGLSLAQIYATIAYYLNNREQVDRYLQEGQQSAEDLRQDLNARHSDFLRDLRQRLTAVRQSTTPT